MYLFQLCKPFEAPRETESQDCTSRTVEPSRQITQLAGRKPATFLSTFLSVACFGAYDVHTQYINLLRVVTALLVAVATLVATRWCCKNSSFKLTHMRTMLGRSIESATTAKVKTRNYCSAHNFVSTVSFGM